MRHYEADMFFYNNGVYTFNPNKLHMAHQWCLISTDKALREGHSVIVSNTFTQLWEMEKYIKLARSLDCQLNVLKTTGDYKSIHNVPEETLIKMKDRWEDYKGEKIAL